MDFINKSTLTKRDVQLRDGRTAYIWVDNQTGHGFLDPKFREDTSVYYNEQYRNVSSATLGQTMRPQEHEEIYQQCDTEIFNRFAGELSSDTKFLEVGPSYGGMLSQVIAKGVTDCSAVEPNTDDTTYLREKFSNLNLYTSIFEEVDFGHATFDFVVCVEVLEHVADLDKFVTKLKSILTPDSKVFFTVPNHRDILKDVYNLPEYKKFYYHKAHIHYFTEESLKALFLSHGIEGAVTHFSMYPFFNNVWWYQNRAPQGAANIAMNTPCPGDPKTEQGRLLNDFYRSVEDQYSDFLTANSMGDHLMFMGGPGFKTN